MLDTNENTILALSDKIFIERILSSKIAPSNTKSVLISPSFHMYLYGVEKIENANVGTSDTYITFNSPYSIQFKDGALFVLFDKSDEKLYPIIYTGITLSEKDVENTEVIYKHFFKVLPYESIQNKNSDDSKSV